MARADGADCLALIDRNAAALATVAAVQGAVSMVAYLADPADAARMIPTALAAFGQMDGLIKAAGVITRAPVATGTRADWDAIFAVNARAPFQMMQAALGDMLGRGAGGALSTSCRRSTRCAVRPTLESVPPARGRLPR